MNKKEKHLEDLLNQALREYEVLLYQKEAYEKMRKEINEYLERLNIIDKYYQIDGCIDFDIKEDLLNILNKVGDSDE